MKRSKLIRVLAVAFAGVMCAFMLSGCMANNAANTQQADNRQYMAKVNQSMDDLQTRLDGFNDAVSRTDLVGMRTQADNAYKAIDDLAALTPPDALKDIQTSYVDGCNDIKDALNLYIDLYTEIENATEEQPFDYATYDSRLKEIQDKYDSGITKLGDGDTKAAELPE